MSILSKLSSLQMRQKLVIAVLAACLIPLGVVSVVSTNQARSALEVQAFNQLESLREVKKKQIENYFAQIRDQIITFSEQDTVVKAMSVFPAAYEALPDEIGATQEMLAANRAGIAGYYKNSFGQEYQAQNDKGVSTESLVPNKAASIIAQNLYIVDNPNPLGGKEALDFAQDGSSYSDAHAKFHPQFRSFLEKFGYYDIFLVDPNTGDIVYSVFKEIDYTTSLLTGPYSNTNFARAFKEARKLAAGDTYTLVDFEPYVPSYEAAASFISSPIYDGSTLIGVLIFQMPVGKINAIMQERSGLGESGETYLLGSDLTMRSQSRFSEKNSILTVSVETESAKEATTGKTGSRIVPDYRGVPVLSSFTPVAIQGLDWVILAEIDEAEAFAAVSSLVILTMVLVACGVVLAFALALFLSSNVLQQLGADPARLLAVTDAIAANDLDMDLDTGKPATGVYSGMQIMQENLRERIEKDQQAIEESTQLKSALDSVGTSVLMVDEQHQIIYVNDTFREEFSRLQTNIRKAIPGFNVETLVGSSIDLFYQDASQQRAVRDGLTASHENEIELDRHTFLLISSPVFGAEQQRLGTVVEWTNRTDELAAERDVQSVVSRVVDGDLTRRISTVDKSGFSEILSDGVNGIVDRLSGAMAEIRDSSSAVQSGAEEISQGNTNLSQRTEEQAASLAETASSMVEITENVRSNAEHAVNANKLATSARDTAERGGEVVGKAIDAMEEINRSSKQIADITGTIDEIAFQTNLLALNASVEAARAGEQGRGFAVVASEVRNLAGRSAEAAKEIKDLIESSVTSVEAGSQLVNASGETLSEIVKGIREVTTIVAEIADASQQQSTGIDEVNTSINQMDEMTQQNAALVEEIAAASDNMRQRALGLTEIVSGYVVDSSNRQEMRGPQNQGSPTGVKRRGVDRPWSGDAPVGTAAETPEVAGGNQR